MTADINDEWPSYGPPPRRATNVVLVTILGISALWLGLMAAALLTIVTPAVLPGRTFSVPLVHNALAAMPAGFSVEAPGADHPFNQPVTILLMGVDQRPGESELAVRTDSIALVRLDPYTRHVTILSIPRDLWVVIHARDGEAYWGRINASYAEGATTGGSIAAGAEQLARDIEANFGAGADHYVWMDIAGAGRLIDALGGVDVDISDELQVPEWRYTEDDVTNPRVLSFPPGKHHLSGYEAVAFSRYRGDSDLYRAQRQQLVLRALLRDPVSWRAIVNPIGTWRAATSTVKSDLSMARLAGLGLLASNSSDNTELYSLGEPVNGSPTVFPITTADGAQVLDWDASNVAYWVALAEATR